MRENAPTIPITYVAYWDALACLKGCVGGYVQRERDAGDHGYRLPKGACAVGNGAVQRVV